MLQVGVKAPGMPTRMTFLPEQSSTIIRVCGWEAGIDGEEPRQVLDPQFRVEGAGNNERMPPTN